MSTSAASTFPRRDARDVRRFFWCIEVSDIDSSGFEFATVDGTLRFHSIRSTSYSDATIFTQQHSCFCDSCVDGGTWTLCQSTEWDDAWAERVLTPLQALDTTSSAAIDDVVMARCSRDYDSLIVIAWLCMAGIMCRLLHVVGILFSHLIVIA